MRSLVGFVPFVVGASLAAGGAARAETLVFKGICDASAAVALDENTIIVGDDEKPWLSIYSVKGGNRLERIDLPQSLRPVPDERKKFEADIEGATVFDDRIVWISSNGRDGDGIVDADRFQLFASHRLGADEESWTPDFSPSFHGLPDAILAASGGSYAPLKNSIGNLEETKEDLAPKNEGFNIEGVSVSRDGKALLIGLRNPQSEKKALLLTLENAAELLDGTTTEAVLGPVIALDLEERGIRDIAWSPARGAYLIAAGKADDEKPGASFALFTWDGTSHPEEMLSFRTVLKDNPDFHPEAVVPLLERSEGKLVPSRSFLVISDDGERKPTDDEKCKKLSKDEKSFRAVVVTGD